MLEAVALPDPDKRKQDDIHPYLSGNFAPVQQSLPLTACTWSGNIPEELYGGEYVRNGGNPVSNEDLGRDAHWFDGDGMLSGVSFRRTEKGVQPEFVNQYILTDVYLATRTSKNLTRPVLPSIATLVNPVATLWNVMYVIFRTIFLVILSRLPGSLQAIKKISVANTAIIFHDGRALATCESGPPMRMALPGLETVGWYNGKRAEGEKGGEEGTGFGGKGIIGFMREWTTAHPRVDPKTQELILFHSTFAPPFVHYSMIPSTHPPINPVAPFEKPTRLLNAPIPGISSAKMMHDFGVSFGHTVIMDLPLSLDPVNIAKGKPPLDYNAKGKSRFGVFPRHSPELTRWFETKACCIFHTANTWDDTYADKENGRIRTSAVNLLACRLNSASVVYAAGNIAIPPSALVLGDDEEEQCRLYYYQFNLKEPENKINHQFGLSALSFEFPSTSEEAAMGPARYIYGCSASDTTFNTSLGKASKIDCLVKMDAETLIKRGKKDPSIVPVTGCVDQRTITEVLASTDRDDPIRVFQLPPRHFAQEPRFVSRKGGLREDDGWLLTYVFDESQLEENGECKLDARSELWIIDATNMKTVAAKIHLPMRVTYGLHGTFIDETKILKQRPVETIRSLQVRQDKEGTGLWLSIRDAIERRLG
ncbi:hypothetical protein PMZ80_010306 [Knufia obscura]|uniref:Carotenoid oxygenase n=2 Tax=Knufia TaxID=430999 RepID=A0AAN8EC91_9EURO|nr:hypothetical protein PMZ80_010306 [Knufia obscura]KAK5951813.1 hypothetical protein OHC33_007105 [Knufia fluminis]